jgi:mycofactocin system glycosyltransferase
LAAATTALVAFLDSDVVPEPGWLDPLLGAFADPAVGLAAPRIVALAPVRGWLGRYEALRSSLDLGPDPALVVPRSRVAYVPSAALVVRRDAAGAGFDDRMRVAEDVDLVLRLHGAGWRLRYEPAARVAHDHRTRPVQWWLRKAYYGTGAAPLALRHGGRFRRWCSARRARRSPRWWCWPDRGRCWARCWWGWGRRSGWRAGWSGCGSRGARPPGWSRRVRWARSRRPRTR